MTQASDTVFRRYVNANNGIGEHMSMREQISILVRLQTIDSDIRKSKIDSETWTEKWPPLIRS